MSADKADTETQQVHFPAVSKLSDLDISTMLNELRVQVTSLEESHASIITPPNHSPERTPTQEFTKKGGFSIR